MIDKKYQIDCILDYFEEWVLAITHAQYIDEKNTLVSDKAKEKLVNFLCEELGIEDD